ncbi:type IV secretion system DNA-binding domain-containing protein, partial [Helicobacter pullorum]
LNFNQQLSILGMDSIIKNQNTSALTALYIFHRLKNTAKNSKKRGFFCFIDELKDFLHDESMRKSILEAILEVRKIGGVMCMGFQNFEIFDDIENSANFLENIANFIIFPTNIEDTLKDMKARIGLTDSEAKFLKETSSDSRLVLLKMPLRQESAILNVDLSSLEQYLKVFSSSSDDVLRIKNLKENHPDNWRQLYLKGEIQ